ncbi:MAG: hypothetical protein EAZ21_08995 [Betaproteobacteria bacterium]|nr:MAG: hypothetical protein EAZ21_08995 [Betaproteobacteria bacterium]
MSAISPTQCNTRVARDCSLVRAHRDGARFAGCVWQRRTAKDRLEGVLLSGTGKQPLEKFT